MILIVTCLTAFTGTVFCQKLTDTMFNSMPRVEMGDYYQKKSKSLKAGGYVLMGVGFAMITASAVISSDDLFTESNNAATADVLARRNRYALRMAYS